MRVAKGLDFVWEEPLRRKDITWAVPLDSARVPCWIEEVRSGYDTSWWVMTATRIDFALDWGQGQSLRIGSSRCYTFEYLNASWKDLRYSVSVNNWRGV